MKKLFVILTIVLALNSFVMAQAQQRVKCGWGASVTASSTQTWLQVEQVPKDDVVSNGTFASTADWTTNVQWVISGSAAFTSTNMIYNGDFAVTNSWKTNGPLWSVAGGVASFLATNIPGTQTMYQALTDVPLVSGRVYRVTYTVGGLSGATFIYPYLGATLCATGTVVGTNGTHIDTITCLQASSNLYFTGYSDTDPGTGTIDNVSIRVNGLVQTNNLSQTITNLINGREYRVTYTVAGLDPTTNTVQALIGNTTGTVRTIPGTYSDDIIVSESSNLIFRVVDTNTSALTIDDVTVREVSDAAYVYELQFYLGVTSPQVYIGLNCDSTTFSNMYNAGRTLLIDSNRATIIQQGNVPQMAPIRGFWYRTASGGATLNVNGY